MKRESIAQYEYYHIYNRGVEKRLIFQDKKDLNRFIRSMVEFNTKKPIGSLFENSYTLNNKKKGVEKIVDIVAYCLNPNHFHMLVYCSTLGGIQKFMQKLGTGYTNYFNEKYKRSGVLFQGKYKAKRIMNNEYLTYLSAYVNLNEKVHKLGSRTPKFSKSSWDFFVNNKIDPIISGTEIITNQFKNSMEYESFAIDSLNLMLENKKDNEISNLLIEMG